MTVDYRAHRATLELPPPTPVEDDALPEFPIDVYAETRFVAADHLTGVEITVGNASADKWFPWNFSTCAEFTASHDVVTWLKDPDLDEIDEGAVLDSVDNTVARCCRLAREILTGRRPTRCEYDVWPVDGRVVHVDAGQILPAGVTHIRRWEWVEIAEHVRQLQAYRATSLSHRRTRYARQSA